MKEQILKHPLVRRVRDWGGVRLLRRIHRMSHRIPVQLRKIEQKKVLVVAPHMDDEVIGPGGAMALHQQMGSEVHVVFCAAGADPESDRTRRAEADASQKIMGFKSLTHIGLPEGHLSSHEPALAAALVNVIRTHKPDHIFVPFVADHHRDHSAVAVALGAAIRDSAWTGGVNDTGTPANNGEVWGFEVWSPLWPNTAIDISAVVDQKTAAINAHASQVAGLHYVEGTLGLNRYRGLRVYVDYAEAYFVSTPGEYVALCGEMNRV